MPPQGAGRQARAPPHKFSPKGTASGPSPHEGQVGVSELAPVSCSAPI